jgi:hypothetical protein
MGAFDLVDGGHPVRGVDVMSIVGAVVVLVIIGLVAFGVFYFFTIKPAAEELNTSTMRPRPKMSC